MTTRNGSFGRNDHGFEYGRPPLAKPAAPEGKVLFDGYMRDMSTITPRTNSMSSNRPQNPEVIDLKDPIQIHLLTETALTDSKGFVILSQEELDNVKKQVQVLTVRIEQARANLAIQSKYRDAAISMAKLYSPTKLDGKKRNLLGNRTSGGGGESAREAELEKLASEKRCGELATELFDLEKRLMDLQKRLLQHTAGILQMTHRASTKKAAPPTGLPLTNGIPGSPESLYTYSNGRNSLEPPADDGMFDDRSLYFPLDQVEGGRPRKNTLEIPLKSPVREQNSELRGEADRLKEENVQLKEAEEQLRAESAGQLQAIVDTERRLQDLNGRMREVIVTINPAREGTMYQPPATVGDGSGNPLQNQLAYLEDALTIAADEQSVRETETIAATAATTALGQMEERLDSINRHIYDILQPIIPGQTPPGGPGAGVDVQLGYLQDSLQAIDAELRRSAELSSSVSASRQDNDQTEAVLMGLWDIIQSGYAGIQQQKAQRRRTRAENGLKEDDEDMSGDEAFDANEQYSLQAFSAKVQWLYAQATSLKEQKGVLKRQIKQQRELNNKSGSEKEVEMKQKLDELEQIRALLTQKDREVEDSQGKLSKALEDLKLMEQTNTENVAAASQGAQQELKARDTEIASLKSSAADAQARLSAAEASLATMQAQFSEASDAQAAAEAAAAKLEKDVKDKDEELERLNVMIIELKTEVTIAKAELDGAYGSRRERAAEAAALSKSSETAGLAAQVDKLKAELASTLKEFEDVTKETIAAEKEKLELEGQLDNAQAAKASLEAELATLREKLDREVGSLREQLDAEKLKAPASAGGAGAGQRAGASMLSEQFRATMKEERRKFQEELREEQAKRRKLEDELRALKRAQGPGKSPLGPLSPR